MTPNLLIPTGVLEEHDDEVSFSTIPPEVTKPDDRRIRYYWRNIILLTSTHVFAVYGFYLMLTSAKLGTLIWALILYQAGGVGIIAGAHRLWSHRSYKAKWPLKLILATLNTIAFQNSIFVWARDHRVHHKYSETDADPYNSKRGFFFSHIGWLLVRKHPEVKEKGEKIDISDLYDDKIVAFQHKYYLTLMPIFCYLLPTLIPIYYWNETFINAFYVNVFRHIFCLNGIWLINSAAHMWGSKPYDKFINPADNSFLSILSSGEGWHNYHHTFPWDYKTAELGKYSVSVATTFIDFFAKIGWAYDLKTVSNDMIAKRVKRTGDGSHEIWGWGDKDQSKDNINDAVVVYQKDN